jgi:2'-5' RNA ligase
MPKSTAIIYWLVPAKLENELFRELIRILAKQFDAPRFEPHLTLLASPDRRQSASKVLQQIDASPIRLRVRGITFSSKFTKTLFVRFESNKSLKKLATNLGHAAKTRAPSLRDPHLSLLYRRLPAPVKKELAATIKLPFREVTFPSIIAVRSALPIRSRSDVKAWKVVARKRLSG